MSEFEYRHKFFWALWKLDNAWRYREKDTCVPEYFRYDDITKGGMEDRLSWRRLTWEANSFYNQATMCVGVCTKPSRAKPFHIYSHLTTIIILTPCLPLLSTL